MTESDHQILVMCWAKKMELAGHKCLAAIFHIPNGEKRSGGAGAKLKAMGVKPGVPDLCLPVANSEYNNLWIEMKRDGGNVSGNQQEMHQLLQSLGGKVVVAWDWKNAIQAICEYLEIKDVVNMDQQAMRMGANV